MASKRTIDLLTESYKEEMTTRRKYEWKNSNGDVIETLYFKPLTRYDRKKAQSVAGTDEALTITTHILCQVAELEDGSKAFKMADAEDLHRFIPENVLNDIELFLFNLSTDIKSAKNE